MIIPIVPQGHVRALVEQPKSAALVAAAEATLNDELNPDAFARTFVDVPSNFKPDYTFGAIAIGGGPKLDAAENSKIVTNPKSSERFLVSGFVRVGPDGVPHHLDANKQFPIYADPLIGELYAPCRPTCGSSRAVGTAADVANQLGAPALHGRGYDGSDVGLAIVDSGIFLPRITHPLASLPPAPPAVPNLDATHSWRPAGLVTRPGYHRVGHGTMCAYDALIVAPKATLLDFPMLLARQTGDHRSRGTVAAAIRAYLKLMLVKPSFGSLVVSNSWGLFHPSLEDYAPTHPGRFIDNRNHIFNWFFVRGLAAAGADIIFCGNNCGDKSNCAGACASGTCLSKTDRMIMGANAYEEVLTIGGCDIDDEVVGYSSRGPSIRGMYPEGSDKQHKPDLVAYTHFFGSAIRTYKIGTLTGTGGHVPDTGVSAACPVAAGCVAALRTGLNRKGISVRPDQLFRALKATARKPPPRTSGWDPEYGHGIINPVAAGRALGLSIP